MNDHIRISGLGIEIYKNDIPGVRWNKAQSFIELLGDGWRLPTKDELNVMYKYKDKIGGFADYYYWSSTEGSSKRLFHFHSNPQSGLANRPMSGPYSRNRWRFIRPPAPQRFVATA